jgi:hypothetical protein
MTSCAAVPLRVDRSASGREVVSADEMERDVESDRSPLGVSICAATPLPANAQRGIARSAQGECAVRVDLRTLKSANPAINGRAVVNGDLSPCAPHDKGEKVTSCKPGPVANPCMTRRRDADIGVPQRVTAVRMLSRAQAHEGRARMPAICAAALALSTPPSQCTTFGG